MGQLINTVGAPVKEEPEEEEVYDDEEGLRHFVGDIHLIPSYPYRHRL